VPQVRNDDQNDVYRTVVTDLTSLIGRVQASLRLLEQTIAREQSLGDQESSADVVVLDDVSPRYLNAAAALQTCDANLGAALHSLLDSGDVDAYAAKASAFSTAET
jgi:hypothetical protein